MYYLTPVSAIKSFNKEVDLGYFKLVNVLNRDKVILKVNALLFNHVKNFYQLASNRKLTGTLIYRQKRNFVKKNPICCSREKVFFKCFFFGILGLKTQTCVTLGFINKFRTYECINSRSLTAPVFSLSFFFWCPFFNILIFLSRCV